MAVGSIVEYIDQSRLICTVCLQDKGNRLHLLTPTNREVNLSPKRTLLISASQIDVAQPRDSAASEAAADRNLANKAERRD